MKPVQEGHTFLNSNRNEALLVYNKKDKRIPICREVESKSDKEGNTFIPILSAVSPNSNNLLRTK